MMTVAVVLFVFLLMPTSFANDCCSKVFELIEGYELAQYDEAFAEELAGN